MCWVKPEAIGFTKKLYWNKGVHEVEPRYLEENQVWARFLIKLAI
jgi:hypothetical protein